MQQLFKARMISNSNKSIQRGKKTHKKREHASIVSFMSHLSGTHQAFLPVVNAACRNC
jgi:hypothetical protein